MGFDSRSFVIFMLQKQVWVWQRKMWTQAVLSPKLARPHHCYESLELTGSSLQQEAGTPPRQISHMEWFKGGWFTAQPPGNTSPFPSLQYNLKLWRWKSLAFLIVCSCYHPACLAAQSFYCRAFSCPVFLLPLLVSRLIGWTYLNMVKSPVRTEFTQ